MTRWRRRAWLWPAAWTCCLTGWIAAAAADVWDPHDNAWYPSNELVHGSEQLHELGPGGKNDPGGRDQDFYRIGQAPLSSYEVLVDGATHQIVVPSLLLERYEGSRSRRPRAPRIHSSGSAAACAGRTR